MDRMTQKMFNFANSVSEKYLNPNTTKTDEQCAVDAGYALRGAAVTASQLLKNPKVVAFIEKRKQKVLRITDVNTERVVRELANIAFSNVTDFINVGEKGIISLTDWGLLSKEQTACIESVCQTKEGYRLKLYSKPTALEQLGKYLSMFNQEPKGYEEPDPFKGLTKERLDRVCDGDLAALDVPNSHVS